MSVLRLIRRGFQIWFILRKVRAGPFAPALLFIKAAAELIINYGQNTDTFHNVLDDTRTLCNGRYNLSPGAYIQPPNFFERLFTGGIFGEQRFL